MQRDFPRTHHEFTLLGYTSLVVVLLAAVTGLLCRASSTSSLASFSHVPLERLASVCPSFCAGSFVMALNEKCSAESRDNANKNVICAGQIDPVLPVA